MQMNGAPLEIINDQSGFTLVRERNHLWREDDVERFGDLEAEPRGHGAPDQHQRLPHEGLDL